MADPVVEVQTNHGSFQITLDEGKAPKSVANFLKYVDDNHYSGTVFHRIISTFMIQGGGYDEQLERKSTKSPVENESTNKVLNKRGTVAMARTPKPDSASSQFFVNVKDNTGLDRANYEDEVGYCVFGKVTKGMDVVDKIKDVKTETQNRMEAVPVEAVTIKSVRVKK